ncbi:asparagine synthase-related protein [Dactylosporangium sp. NPDC051485]|uniref:asparagine synthetase B family protein n=1 Tax=Dactylosporangium sp. NPDC051485 TaxID=3154846 RepID=UPI003414F014
MHRIAGWVDPTMHERLALPTLQTIADAMSAEAGADTATWTSGDAALARTAAVQPTAAPAVATHGGVTVVADAALTNTDELRRHLTRYGAVFRTRADEEVVLHAFLRWGGKAVARLDGAFAVAAYDVRTRRLFLARDRFGVKPLHHALLPGGGLVFASTVRGVLAHPRVTAQVGPEGLADLLLTPTWHVPGRTVLDGVDELAPGHRAWMDGRHLSVERWWQLQPRRHGQDDPATIRTVFRLLAEQTAGHARGHHNVVVATGGGVDSAALAALTAGADRAEVCTATLLLRVPEPRTGDSGAGRPARDVAAYLDLAHVDIVAGTGHLLDTEPVTRAALDRPAPGADTIGQHRYLRQLAARTDAAPVVLTGTGADETFADGTSADAGLRSGPADGFDLDRLLRADVAAVLHPDRHRAQRLASANAGLPDLSHLPPADQRRQREVLLALGHLLPARLGQLDRLAAVTGVDLRHPYLEHHMVAYALALPASTACLGGHHKGVLRHAVADLLPDKTTWGSGTGWPSGDQLPQWRSNRRLSLAEQSTDPASALHPLLDPRAVAGLLARTDPAAERAIAYLVDLDAWLRGVRVVFT